MELIVVAIALTSLSCYPIPSLTCCVFSSPWIESLALSLPSTSPTSFPLIAISLLFQGQLHYGWTPPNVTK